LKIVKDTPLEIGWLVWQARPPRPSLTVVVKGTFDLAPSGACPISALQALLTGDEYHDGDVERSTRYASDFALLKPHGECLLMGSYRAPAAAKVTSAVVSFRVGKVMKRLALVGDRHWKAGLLGGATDPLPLQTVPLCWERCFGGSGVELNPVGRGIAPLRGAGNGLIALPNIESPTAMVRSPADRPDPAGAFPIAPTWPSRRAFSGTYDEAWQRTRWPFFPEDFDWGYFNAAPRDQQIEGYWRGDEEIELNGLHPAEPLIQCRLPGVRPRVFLHQVGADAGLREVALNLDTITLDVDTLRAHVVWRGLAEIARETLEGIPHIFVVHEPLARPSTPVECDAWFERQRRRLAEEEGAFAAEAPPPAAAAAASVAVPAPAGASQPREKAAALRERVQRALLDGVSCAGWELIDADLSDLDLARADFTRALLTRVCFDRSSLDEARLDGAILHEATMSRASFRGASLAGALLTLARGAEVVFDGANLDDVQGGDASFPGARFLKTSLRRAELARVDLTSARFEDTVLDGADLAGAMLDGAVFVRSSLVDTSLEGGASAKRARFDGCDLRRLRASEGADFTGASLRDASAAGARFAKARLDRAQLTGATLDGADFSEASLAEASLARCSLRKARFDDAAMVGATLRGSDLHEARLEGADLRGADLRGANLHGAELWKVRLEGTPLEGADLSGTKLG
jgi:uncharacterized protein YjbI with pentapeptide repeats